MTSPLSWSYWVLHCFFSAASLGLLEPLGTGCFFLAATHFVKLGGSGGVVWPPVAEPDDPLLIHLSNSDFSIVWSPTLATEPDGTSLPQPPTVAAPTATIAAQASWIRANVIRKCLAEVRKAPIRRRRDPVGRRSGCAW